MTALEASTIRPPAARPLLMSGDPAASLRVRGVDAAAGAALGRLVREDPDAVAALHRDEIAAGADVVVALTSATTTRALSAIGMAFRAAALTGAAVDLALEAAAGASRRIAVAGVLGHTAAAPSADRIAEDYATHAARLAAAGCEILVACGFAPAQAAGVGPALARLARRAAVVSASTTQLATWALVEIGPSGRTADGEGLEEAARAALDAGADALLVEVPSAELGLAVLERVGRMRVETQIGLLLATAGDDAAKDPSSVKYGGVDAWVASAVRLIDAGADMLGGGAGTTVGHLGGLSKTLRARHAPLLRRAL